MDRPIKVSKKDIALGNRLLTEQEILNACAIRAKDASWKTMTSEEKFKASSKAITLAQLLKTDEEWVRWINNVGLAITHSEWESRKKEIGI